MIHLIVMQLYHFTTRFKIILKHTKSFPDCMSKKKILTSQLLSNTKRIQIEMEGKVLAYDTTKAIFWLLVMTWLSFHFNVSFRICFVLGFVIHSLKIGMGFIIPLYKWIASHVNGVAMHSPDELARLLNDTADDHNQLLFDDCNSGSEKKIYDVIIIGGGCSGIATAKHCIEEGLTKILILEKRDNFGGVWYYSEDYNISSVCKETEATSSQQVTELVGLSMNLNSHSKNHNHITFATQNEFFQYMINYSKKYNLYKYAKFNQNVQSALFDKKSKIWQIKSQSNCNDDININNNVNVYKSRFIAVCAGLNAKAKNIPQFYQDCACADSNIDVINACMIKNKEDVARLVKNKKNILIVGGGETSCYIATQLFGKVNSKTGVICRKEGIIKENDNNNINVYWSIRNGQWFMRKRGKYFNSILDEVSSVFHRVICPFVVQNNNKLSKPGSRWACKLFTNGSIFCYGGHGYKEWKPNYPFWRGVVNKEGHCLEYLNQKLIIPKCGIKYIDKNNDQSIIFNDNSIVHNIDCIILCRGYTNNINCFLPNDYDKPKQCFKYVLSFNNPGPSLAYIGYVKPVAGSFNFCSQIPTRLVVKIWKYIMNTCNHNCNNSNEDINSNIEILTNIMKKMYEKDEIYWNEYFKDHPTRNNINCLLNQNVTLVDPFYYVYQMYKTIYPPHGLNMMGVWNAFGFISMIKVAISTPNPCQIDIAKAVYMYNNGKANGDKTKMIKAKKLCNDTINQFWQKKYVFETLYWEIIVLIARYLQLDLIVDVMSYLRYRFF